MAKTVAELVVDLKAETARFRAEMAAAADHSRRQTDRITAAVGAMNRQMDTAARAVRGFVGAWLSIEGITRGVRALVSAADTYARIETQLRLVTGSAQELSRVQEQLFDVAQRTSVEMETTVGLYSRFARASQELGLSQGQLLQLTETINQTMAISGTSAESASGALMQLGQAMAAGALRGDELNSVMEGTPRLAQAIADGMGVSIGELRKLGEQGELTAERVAQALLDQAIAIEAEFANVSSTVDQAMTRAGNSVERLLATFDDAIGISDAFRRATDELATVFDRLTEAINGTISAQGVLDLARLSAFGGILNMAMPETETVAGLDAEIAAAQERYAALRREMTAPSGPGAGMRSPTQAEAEALAELGREIDAMIARRDALRGVGRGVTVDITRGTVAPPPPPGTDPLAAIAAAIPTAPRDQLLDFQREIEARVATTQAGITAAIGAANQRALQSGLDELLALQEAIEARLNASRPGRGGGGGGRGSSTPTPREETDHFAEWNASIRDRIRMLEVEADALAMAEEAATAYRLEQEAILALTRQGVELTPEQTEQIAAQAAAYAAAEQQVRQVREEQEALEQQARDLEELYHGLGDAAVSAFGRAIQEGASFRDVVLGLIGDLLRLKAVQEGIGSFFADLFSGGLDFGGLFGGGGGGGSYNPGVGPGGMGFTHFGGPRAEGGPVAPGLDYLVGEEGPEIVRFGAAGTVIPNDELGGGDVHVTLNIATGVSQTVRAEIQGMLPQITRHVIGAVADARRRGGSFAAAFGG